MSWLGDSAAVAVLSFDVDAESPILAQGRRYADHAMVMTHQAYGPLVGVPRLLGLLQDFALKATFFVPGLTADRYPQTVEQIAAAGHEIGHHSYSHRSPVDLGAAGEREDFERALEALERVGVKPTGHRSAPWEAGWGRAGGPAPARPPTGPPCGRRAGTRRPWSPSTGSRTTPHSWTTTSRTC